MKEGLTATVTIDLDNDNESLAEQIDNVMDILTVLANTYLTWHSLDKILQTPKILMKCSKDQMQNNGEKHYNTK